MGSSLYHDSSSFIVTTEISFFCNENNQERVMEAEFLASSMIIYIERDIATSFSCDPIIEDFKSLKERKSNTLTKGNFCFF